MKQISFLIVFLIIHTLSAQIPTELKGKWKGEIITQNQGREITGMAVVNIGQKKAKNENEVFFDLSQYTSSRIYVFEELTVNYKDLSDAGEVGFTSNHSLVIDANRNSVEGDFDFYLSKYGDRDCLIGHFQSKSGVKAKIVLFRKNEYFQVFNTSQYANWKKDISPTKGRVITDKDIPTILFEEPQVVEVELTPNASKWFAKSKSQLTNEEKNAAVKALNIPYPEFDKEHTSSWYDEATGVGVYPLDINGDGVEEIFFCTGMSVMRGNPISEYYLVAKNLKTGTYSRSELLHGILTFLETKTNGYNDMTLGGPGFTFPIYKWNGSNYQRSGTVSDEYLKSVKMDYMRTLSEDYENSIQN